MDQNDTIVGYIHIRAVDSIRHPIQKNGQK